ncbi:MAG: tRNA (cytidine(56)-2'-O)-methyltransferase [Thermoprotei archaeon]
MVLRLNHRHVRDERLTTHVGLTARAFGADGVIIADTASTELIKSLYAVTNEWGGSFWVLDGLPALETLREWKRSGGLSVHLTMYGEPLHKVIPEIYWSHWLHDKRIIVVVGSAKVGSEIYRACDYNVAIGNQPHSEVAALAVFLYELGAYRKMGEAFKSGKVILPRLEAKGRIKAHEET